MAKVTNILCYYSITLLLVGPMSSLRLLLLIAPHR